MAQAPRSLPGALLLGAAAFCLAACSSTFVGPAPAGAGAPSALRGARAESEPKSVGSLVFGASAVALLAAASNRRHTRNPVRIVLQAEGDKIRLEDLEVSDDKKYTGKVVRDAKIGVYVDIGAEKDALLPRGMVPKGKQYAAGDKIEGLKVYEVEAGSDPSTRKIRVTLGDLPKNLQVGDKVTGKVASIQTYGVFFDVGATRDALAPSRTLAQQPSDYSKGEEVELEVISIEDQKITVATAGMAAAAAPPTAVFAVGQKVTGTVARVNAQYGVFFNIGAQGDALCYTRQLDKDLDEYKEGDKVEGLNISKIDGDKIEVTTRPLSSQAKVGQKVTGIVMSKLQEDRGVFFDAGFSNDVLAPPSLLSKPVDEYAMQEVADLIITSVDGDRVNVSDRNPEDIPKSIDQFIRGQEVTGKVMNYVEMSGIIYVDVGAVKDATWRTKGAGATKPSKPVEELTRGTEVSLIVTRADAKAQLLEVAEAGAEVVETGVSISTLKVGDVVSGTVTRSQAFGVFVNIGAERDALYVLSQLEKPLDEYKPGMELKGLRVTEVDRDLNRLAVSMRPGAGDFTLGQEVTGKVSKKMTFGIFVDIGASNDALLPAALLAKDLEEYQEGETLEKLTISRLTVEENKITVSQGGGGKEATVSFKDLEEGKQINGVVRAVRDYGAFIDIGLGRTDALMPNSMMGDKGSGAFKPGDDIEVWIVRADEESLRVTVSAVEPTAEMRAARGGRRRARSSADSYIPVGFMVPDPRRHWEMMGERDEMMDDEPTPWYDWAKKFPGFVRFTEEDQVIVISPGAYGFWGNDELNQADKVIVRVPKHLQKPDAVEPTEEDLKINLQETDMPTYEKGISPKIHTKYRQPPMNDPNWRFHDVYDEKRTNISMQAVLEAVGPFIPPEKPGQKRVKESADGDK